MGAYSQQNSGGSTSVNNFFMCNSSEQNLHVKDANQQCAHGVTLVNTNIMGRL